MLVAPSILSANFGRLEEEIVNVCKAGADLIHVDVMDGHFVPNLTLGPVVVQGVAKAATAPLDVHLMVQNNTFFVDLFAPLKPKYISFHIEEEKHPHRLANYIRSKGISPAITLNPHTHESAIEYMIEEVDMVLVMSVNPGFGGQSFIESSLGKIAKIKEMILRKNSQALIQVDGGVNNKNIGALKNAGVDIVVAGSYVFGHESYKDAIDSLKG